MAGIQQLSNTNRILDQNILFICVVLFSLKSYRLYDKNEFITWKRDGVSENKYYSYSYYCSYCCSYRCSYCWNNSFHYGFTYSAQKRIANAFQQWLLTPLPFK